jgi:hypothetical protein
VVSQKEVTGGWTRGQKQRPAAGGRIVRWGWLLPAGAEAAPDGGYGCPRLEQRRCPAVGMAAPGWRRRPAAGVEASPSGWADRRRLFCSGGGRSTAGQVDDDRSRQGSGSDGCFDRSRLLRWEARVQTLGEPVLENGFGLGWVEFLVGLV